MLEHLVHSEPEGGVRPPLPQEAGWTDLLGRGDDLTKLSGSLTEGVIGVGPFKNVFKIFHHRTELDCTVPLSIYCLRLGSALQVIASLVVNNLRKFVFSADNLNLT